MKKSKISNEIWNEVYNQVLEEFKVMTFSELFEYYIELKTKQGLNVIPDSLWNNIVNISKELQLILLEVENEENEEE